MSMPRHNAKRDALFVCATCGQEKQGRTSRISVYCSEQCKFAAYSGEGNPNYRRAGRRTCAKCGSEFQSYNKARQFCSRSCYALKRSENTPPKLTKQRKAAAMSVCAACGNACPARQKFCSISCSSKTRFPPLNRTCRRCGTPFRTSPSGDRSFCSYTCFVEDGGAVRAGNAAAEAIMKKYGAKKDANHKEIMDVIRQITAVHDLSHAGYGVPDGVAWVGGSWQLFDIKNLKTSYGKKGLNERQKQWARDWRGGPVYLVHDEHEAQCFARGNLESLKCEGGFKAVNNG